MRSVVTGGAGFIGSHLADRLKQRGDEVLVIDNFSSGSWRADGLSRQGIDIDSTDIRQERLLKIVADFGPDQVFHLAAQIDVRRSVADPILDAKINVVGLLRVLEATSSAGARLMFASSGGTIYGDAAPDDLPLPESASGRPTAPYGITKRVAEDYLRFYRELRGLRFVSLALANV
jgi:UDP-glucose 4-epimerase